MLEQLAMTMRATLFASGGYKLDTGKREQVKSQVGAADSFVGLKREPSNYVIGVPNVLVNIHNSGGQQQPQQHHAKAKVAGGDGQVRRAGQTPLAGAGQEENWVHFGALTPPGEPMGGEGTPVKSKALFSQASHGMGKTEPAMPNGSKQQPVAGGGDSRGTEGKRRKTRKGAGHPAGAPPAGCIRQILLLQLELIEQQQQQLQSKSTEIDELKAEKEMLVARIERMERRLQMVKKDSCDGRRSSHAPGREERAAATPEGRGYGHRPLHFGGRGGKCHKRFLFQDSPMAKSRRGQLKSSPQKVALSPEEEASEGAAQDGTVDSAAMEELPYLCTTDMYLCRWQEPPPSPWKEEPSPRKDESVAIPSWRENIMDPLGDEDADDIPENLNDNVFLKRHSKLELDEKRRKRWDIQRIREQRMFQRLQQRMDRRKGVLSESEPEVLSFWPEAEEVESLMITPYLPVVAFGRPLPKLTQQSFDLPWLDERSRCRAEVPKKQTPHRTCRK